MPPSHLQTRMLTVYPPGLETCQPPSITLERLMDLLPLLLPSWGDVAHMNMSNQKCLDAQRISSSGALPFIVCYGGGVGWLCALCIMCCVTG